MPESLDQVPGSPLYIQKEKKSGENCLWSCVEHPGLGLFRDPHAIPDAGSCFQSLTLLFSTLKTPPTRIWVSKRTNKWKIMNLPLMHGGHDMDI